MYGSTAERVASFCSRDDERRPGSANGGVGLGVDFPPPRRLDPIKRSLSISSFPHTTNPFFFLPRTFTTYLYNSFALSR
jgi:hypothetical protein